jgi:hypothetical protein
MNHVARKRSGYLYAAIIFFLLSQYSYAQSDVVTLSRIKDFINAELTYIILSNDSLQKDSGHKNWNEIATALRKNTVANPVYYAAMKKLLEGRFDSVAKKFSSKVDLIDVTKYTGLSEEKAMQVLYDTAFTLMTEQYGKQFAASIRDSIYTLLLNRAASRQNIQPLKNIDTVQKTKVKKSSEPVYVPWYARFQGFLFWLLACVLISVALFLYCLDQIRQLKIKLTEAEKVITQIREEKDPLAPHSGPVTTVYTEFRNLVTLKIKELYDIIDHLNLRLIAVEKREKSPSLIEEAAVANDATENDGDIFYMGLPLEGYFPFSSRALKKDALYKFSFINNKTEAQYEVINDGIPVSEVLKDIPKFLEPACVAENEPQGEVRVLITKAPGIAIFDGEKWAIEQKAIILFI